MPTQGTLLTVAIAVETPTALVLILIPGLGLRLLFGADPDGVGLMAGRIAGVMLLSLVIACWGARKDAVGAARASTLGAITCYNAGTGAFFVLFALTGQAQGPVIWVAGLVHLALAVAFLAAQRRSPARSAVSSWR